MIKLVYCFKRRPDLGLAEFSEHWERVHGPIAVRIPRVRKIIQSVAFHDERDLQPPDFDGMAELWFDDVEALLEARRSPVWTENREDQREFIDLSSTAYFLSRERRIV